MLGSGLGSCSANLWGGRVRLNVEGWTVSVEGILGGRACDGSSEGLLPAGIEAIGCQEKRGLNVIATTIAVVSAAILLTKLVSSICWLRYMQRCRRQAEHDNQLQRWLSVPSFSTPTNRRSRDRSGPRGQTRESTAPKCQNVTRRVMDADAQRCAQ